MLYEFSETVNILSFNYTQNFKLHETFIFFDIPYERIDILSRRPELEGESFCLCDFKFEPGFGWKGSVWEHD
jgi:hypothetical protein